MRLGLILPDTDDPWRAYNLRLGFGEIARQAAQAGWTVDLIEPGAPLMDAGASSPAGVRRLRLATASPPVLTGPGPTSLTRSLQLGHRLWRHARASRYDVMLGPLAGGLLQPCLMSRALGEALETTAIGIWGDVPTSRRVQSDETLLATIKPLVDDALERGCLALADAVFAPSSQEAERLAALANAVLPAVLASLPDPPNPRRLNARTARRTRRDLVFVGPGREGYGVQRLLAVLDRVSLLPDGAERVVFAGPWRDDAPGHSKTLLGLRAAGWRAEFELLDTDDPGQVLARLTGSESTALFLGSDTDDDVLLRQVLAQGVPVMISADHRLAPVRADPADAAAEPAALGERIGSEDVLLRSDWGALLERLVRERQGPVPKTASRPRVSVCVSHVDRPDALRRAVASIGMAEAQVIVADAGSREAASLHTLQALDVEGCVVLQLGPSAQGAACDRAALEATGEVLAFLDDDNVYREGGCARLATALISGPFDIVVTNLALHDGLAGVGAPAAHLAFLGDPGSAGLFFNGFGDVSLAIRRKDFLRVGGFGAYDGPALDWAFLARARSRGLKIGVLQDPAVAYARDVETGRGRWRKLDGEGARRTVLECYEGTFDAGLVARFAQAACSDLLQI